MTRSPITASEIRALAEFRYQLRRYLRRSELLVRQYEITSLQYQMLLQLKGYPGREWANVGELAERLQSHHHGVVSLVSRCEKLGLVTRRTGREDGRSVEIHLTEKGDELVTHLAQLHREELLNLHGQFFVPTQGRLGEEVPPEGDQRPQPDSA